MGGVADYLHVLVLLRIGALGDRIERVTGIELLHRLELVAQIDQFDLARRGEVHHGAGGNRRTGGEGDRVSVLHLGHGIGIGYEAHLDVVVSEPVYLQELLGDLLGSVAARLGGNRLALEIFDRVDAGIGAHDDLEILRIERRDVANVAVRLREWRSSGDRIDGGNRVAEADIGLAFLDAAHVGDSGSGQRLHGRVGNRFFPQVLQLTTQRHPGAALRPGHELEVGRREGSCQRDRKYDRP